MSLFKKPEYPTVSYPTIIEGVVDGPMRCESLDGSEMYIGGDNEVHVLKNFGPFEKDGKTWAVTHLQKKSKKGWLKTSPDGYHCWNFWQLQKQDNNGNWISGTERGIYFRKPFSWRWDVAGTFLDGALRHFVWTKGFLGLHWD